MAAADQILTVGDLFQATIEEDVSDSNSSRDLIVSYNGHLFRVKNSTGKKFRKGDRLELLVVGKNPLELRLMGEGSRSLNRFA